MYKIILKRGNYATILKDGKELEAMAGIYVTTADLAEMDELIRLANYAQQSAQTDVAKISPHEHDFGTGIYCSICGEILF